MIIPNDILLAVFLGSIVTMLCIWLLYNRYQRKGNKASEIFRNELWIHTPLIKSEWLSSYISADHTVNLKLEALQPSKSFKIRGISTFMKQKFRRNSNIDTFVTTSSANAGMAVCYTAHKFHCKCIVILDESQTENELLSTMTNEYNAKTEFYGKTWNEADEYALKLCESNEKLCYVPMFDDTAIFEGHASIVTELASEYSNDTYPDCIIVSVGGGGLLNGVLLGLFQVGWSRETKVVAAQSENAQLFAQGVHNSYKPIPTKTITSDGVELGHRAISGKTMELAAKYSKFNAIKSMVVSDLDVLNVCTLFAVKEHILIEPLCGVAIAALYKNKDYFKQFRNICIVVCGGNHTYYNKQLLDESIKNGMFNENVTPIGLK